MMVVFAFLMLVAACMRKDERWKHLPFFFSINNIIIKIISQLVAEISDVSQIIIVSCILAAVYIIKII